MMDHERIRAELAARGLAQSAVEFVMQRLRAGHRIASGESSADDLPLGASHVGGVPDMPRDWEWPAAPDGRPLSFLAQINLADLPRAALDDPLPKRGRLLFFYYAEEQPWGYKPEDCGSWRVLFCAIDNEHLTRHIGPERLGANWRSEPEPVTFVPTLFLPSGMTLGSALPGGLEWEETARYEIGGGAALVESAPVEPDPDDPLGTLRMAILDEYYDAWADELNGAEDAGVDHRLLGHPREDQNAMPPEFAQLIAERPDQEFPNPHRPGQMVRIPGQRADAWPAWARELLGQTRAGDWRLLLQLDSDVWMWGDCGKLYFWIPRADLAACRFDRVWLQLQCG